MNNRVYRLVRHRCTGTLVPVSELSRSSGKSGRGRQVGITPKLLLAIAGMVGSVGYAGAAEIVVDGGAEETVPGSQPNGWKTPAKVNLVIGDTGKGSLVINEGAKATTVGAGYLGREAGSLGKATISGAGSQWTLNNYDPLYGQDLKVGIGGEGVVEVLDGGLLKVSHVQLGVNEGAKGNMTISGAGSQWLGHQIIVGNQGTGELTISDGGKYMMDTFGKVIVGNDSNSVGVVNVDGVGSELYYGAYGSSNIYVGYAGQGVMNITNGARAGAQQLNLGTEAGAYGELNLSGAGSSVTNVGGVIFRVGDKGEGRVNITDGALFNGGNSGSYLGDSTGSKGTALISGTGSTWRASLLVVGNYGEGTMNIVDGGSVTGGTMRIGANMKSEGSVLASGANTKITVGGLEVGTDGVGSLRVEDGAQVVVNGDRGSFGGLKVGVRQANFGTAPASGNMTITGEGTQVSAQLITIAGGKGEGTLTVTDGARLKMTDEEGSLVVATGGTLNIGSGAKAGIVEAPELVVQKAGILNLNYTDNIDFTAALEGSGTVNHLGSGITQLMSTDSLFRGTVNLVAGTIRAGVANALGGNILSPAVYHVGAAGSLDLAGFSSTLSGLSNAGVVSLGGKDSAGTRLTLINASYLDGSDGSYHGDGGTLKLNTVLGGDDSVTDSLYISGSSSGHSWLQINNLGGQGAETIEGIQVISIAKESNGLFTLKGPVVAGAYEYLLHKGGKQNPTNGDWYLRSEAIIEPEIPEPEVPEPETPEPETPEPEVPEPETPEPETPEPEVPEPEIPEPETPEPEVPEPETPEPETPEPEIPEPERPDPGIPPTGGKPSLLRVDAAAYLNNQNAAVHMFDHSRADRMGEPGFGSRGEDGQGAVWMRAKRSQLDAGVVGHQLSVETDVDVMQLGAELQHAIGSGRLHTGVMMGYGSADTKATSDLTGRSASGKVTGTSVGVYGTWYQDAAAPAGLYLDSWVQYGRYDNEVHGSGLTREEYKSNTWSGSLEAGYALALYEGASRGLYLEPQGQIIYTRYRGDAHTENNGTRIAAQKKSQTTARLGARLFSSALDPQANQVQPFLQVNWWSGGNDATIEMNGTRVQHALADDVYEAKAGVQVALGKGWSAAGNIGVQGGKDDFSDVSGQLGVRYSW